MNANNMIFESSFFSRCVSVYALCATLALPALGQDSGNPGNADAGQDVKVSDYGTVDISVQDTDLATVLQMLSIESKKNIITSKGVSATVSANLYDVTFYEALKAILDVNGYTFYEEGNFIYVITKEEAVEMEKARRKTESRIFELNYLSAADANEFIQPLLSEAGKASVRGEVQPGIKPDVANAGADEYAFAPRLVINDYPEHLDAIGELLTSLDTPPQQVLVESTILQTALNEDNAFGVDFTVLGSLNFTDLTNPLSAVTNLLSGKDAKPDAVQPADNKAQAVTSTVGNTAGPAGFRVGVISDDISVFLRVLDEVTDTTVLARPKVMALNRQRAEVLVGTKVGYLSTTSTETTTTQSVQFLDTGVQLIFRPFISTDGMIRLELKPSVSDFRLRDVTDSTGNTVTIPDELTNQVTTNVRVKDGQTLVLGGLFKDRTQTTRRQVPLLGDVPIVGAAFRGQDDRIERSEVIFLITPTIIQDATLWAIGEDQLGAVDSLRVGARAQLLPFSREKVTSNYNQKALDAYNQGDFETALYYINNSLSMNPTQPEMIRLREQITGERAKSHERSLMERTFRRQLGAIEPEPMEAESAAAAEPASTETASKDEAQPTTPEVAVAEVTVDPAETPAVDPAATEVVDATPSSESSSEVDSQQSALNTPSSEGVQSEPSVSQQEVVEVTPQSDGLPDLSSANTPNANLDSAQQWMFYQQFLFDFFVSLNMPEMASNFGCEENGEFVAVGSPDMPGSPNDFPFVTFDDVAGNRVAGVSMSENPEP